MSEQITYVNAPRRYTRSDEDMYVDARGYRGRTMAQLAYEQALRIWRDTPEPLRGRLWGLADAILDGM